MYRNRLVPLWAFMYRIAAEDFPRPIRASTTVIGFITIPSPNSFYSSSPIRKSHPFFVFAHLSIINPRHTFFVWFEFACAPFTLRSRSLAFYMVLNLLYFFYKANRQIRCETMRFFKSQDTQCVLKPVFKDQNMKFSRFNFSWM